MIYLDVYTIQMFFTFFHEKIPPLSGGIKQGDMKKYFCVLLFTKSLVRPVVLSLESGQMMNVD